MRSKLLLEIFRALNKCLFNRFVSIQPTHKSPSCSQVALLLQPLHVQVGFPLSSRQPLPFTDLYIRLIIYRAAKPAIRRTTTVSMDLSLYLQTPLVLSCIGRKPGSPPHALRRAILSFPARPDTTTHSGRAVNFTISCQWPAPR